MLSAATYFVTLELFFFIGNKMFNFINLLDIFSFTKLYKTCKFVLQAMREGMAVLFAVLTS